MPDSIAALLFRRGGAGVASVATTGDTFVWSTTPSLAHDVEHAGRVR